MSQIPWSFVYLFWTKTENQMCPSLRGCVLLGANNQYICSPFMYSKIIISWIKILGHRFSSRQGRKSIGMRCKMFLFKSYFIKCVSPNNSSIIKFRNRFYWVLIWQCPPSIENSYYGDKPFRPLFLIQQTRTESNVKSLLKLMEDHFVNQVDLKIARRKRFPHWLKSPAILPGPQPLFTLVIPTQMTKIS